MRTRRLVRAICARSEAFVNDHGTELRVKTVKYFKSIERVQDEVEATREKLAKKEGSGEGY